ncbi:hypothetical protein nbrc107696_35070 [Gordonia spumicola]|uniref:Thioesterase n=1 Tax=Gordonia spumicola TaxID=589161 RepID=A0A7I9VD25_9ACTN|nr:thioesterase family protein [Gordonia spumicola]GEE03061.1 hypothetical protein nbrc107696_35070 [Gordonia spumicola]
MSETENSSGAAEPYVVEVALRWGDQDSLGHINNVQVARVFEEARVRTMSSWFGPARSGFVGVIARQEIEFASILHYSTEPVRVRIAVTRIGTSSFDFGCTLYTPDGTVAALCETTLAGLDLTTGAKPAIPDSVRAVLEARSGDPVPFRRRR